MPLTQGEASCSQEGEGRHLPRKAAACGLGDVPSLWWPHESGVGHAKCPRAGQGGGSALRWRECRSHILATQERRSGYLLSYFTDKETEVQSIKLEALPGQKYISTSPELFFWFYSAF